MKKQEHIENQIDRALNSLEGIQRAEANPYLYTRIKARLDGKEGAFWNVAANFLTRPVAVMATFLFLVIMNITFIVESRRHDVQPTAAEQTDETQLVASDYNMAQTAFYDQTFEMNEAVSKK